MSLTLSLCTGDALDENCDLSGDEDDGDGDDSQEESEEDAAATGRAQQASGSHPLQQSFKAAAGELLKKYGIAPDDAGGLVSRRELHPMA